MEAVRTDKRIIAIGFIIIYSIMPIVGQAVSTYFTTYAYMSLVVITILSIIMRNGYSINMYISILAPFICYIFLSFFVSADSIVLWGYRSMLFLLPIILGYYLIYEIGGNNRRSATVLLFSIMITIITTIIGTRQYPYASRILATIADSQDENNVFFNWRNIGGYGFVYTAVLLYPLVIFSFKQRKISLLTSIFLSMLMFALAIFSEYTTALLLVIMTTFLYFIKKEFRTKDVFTLGIVLILFLLMFYGFFSTFLIFIGTKVDSETIQERIFALAGGVEGLEAAEDNRLELYRKVFNLFLSHPLTGTMFGNKAGVWGHSQTLITLAQHGLVGGAVMYCMYRKIYRLFYKPFSAVPGFGFYLWVFIEAIVLSTVNTYFFFDVLAFYAPLLFCNINGISISEYYGELEK